MNYCCENCGWSEIVGSPIMCHYTGHRTWLDECCEAWKPKDIDAVPVVRCKDCKHVCLCDAKEMFPDMPVYAKCTLTDETHEPDWFCADGERKKG